MTCVALAAAPAAPMTPRLWHRLAPGATLIDGDL